MNLQTLTIVILATAGLASFLRALPWPKEWLQVKPWICPACGSGWASLFVLSVMFATGRLDGWLPGDIALTWLASLPLSMWLYAKLYPPDVELPLP